MPEMLIRGVKYHYEWLGASSQETELRPAIVCLHGFTGSWRSFQQLAHHMPHWRFLAVDLLGHGQSCDDAPPERCSLSQMSADLAQLLRSLLPEPYVLYGYSMGGRAALTMTLTQHLRLHALIIENAQPGLDPHEAQERRENSEKLADWIMDHSLEEFVDFWENLPLFAVQQKLPEQQRAQLRASRLAHTKAGLAASMRYANVGRQENFWPQLGAITAPFLFITGEHDQKYKQIGARVADEISSAELFICEGAGHNVHEERPQQLASALNTWLARFAFSTSPSPQQSAVSATLGKTAHED